MQVDVEKNEKLKENRPRLRIPTKTHGNGVATELGTKLGGEAKNAVTERTLKLGNAGKGAQQRHPMQQQHRDGKNGDEACGWLAIMMRER